MDIVLTFIFLRLMLVFIFILTGYFLSGEDGKKHYWLCSLPAIVAFSLIEGLRYDRGVDYFHYKKLFENSLNLSVYYDIDSIEPLFQIINKVIKILGLSYPVVFVFYSFILIFAGFFFLRQYKDCAPFLVPLFFLAIVTPAENIVRQFVAIAFVLIALSFFNSKQWIKFCSFILFAFLTHYSSIVLLPFILLFSKFGVFLVKKKIVLITILTLFILSFFWKIEYWSHIYNYIPVLNFGSGRYQSYLERSHIWFSGEQTLDYVSNLTMFNSIRTFFLN
ncbi:MAG: EpsG family protein, partial [Fibrobacter sp.]|nr:EpsG family protein [Fibrobacter sp.]